jgi:integrase
MASFRKNKAGKWEAQIARKGVRRSGTFDTKAEATKWAHKIESEILGGKKGAVDKTFGDLMIRYQKEVTPTKGSSHVETKSINRILKDSIANVRLRDLDSSHFAEWRNNRLKGASGGTVARTMATMSAALNVAVREWKWIDHSPIKEVTKPKQGPARDRRISEDEIERLMFAAGYDYDDKPESVAARTGAAFLFAIETGMRAGELATLTMDRVNFEKKTAHIRAQDSKGRVKRDVPLSAEAIRIIKQMDVKEGLVFGVTSVQITRAFIVIKDACLIKDMTFHDTRHEAITRLAKKMDAVALARTVGHRNLNQLLIYYNESAADLAKRL